MLGPSNAPLTPPASPVPTAPSRCPFARGNNGEFGAWAIRAAQKERISLPPRVNLLNLPHSHLQKGDCRCVCCKEEKKETGARCLDVEGCVGAAREQRSRANPRDLSDSTSGFDKMFSFGKFVESAPLPPVSLRQGSASPPLLGMGCVGGSGCQRGANWAAPVGLGETLRPRLTAPVCLPSLHGCPSRPSSLGAVPSALGIWAEVGDGTV